MTWDRDHRPPEPVFTATLREDLNSDASSSSRVFRSLTKDPAAIRTPRPRARLAKDPSVLHTNGSVDCLRAALSTLIARPPNCPAIATTARRNPRPSYAIVARTDSPG
jgi:hypothetical protein